MQQDPFDDSMLLRLSGHVDKVLVRIVVIAAYNVLHPIAFTIDVGLKRCFLEKLDLAARHTHFDDANPYIARHRICHLFTERVHHTNAATAGC